MEGELESVWDILLPKQDKTNFFLWQLHVKFHIFPFTDIRSYIDKYDITLYISPFTLITY